MIDLANYHRYEGFIIAGLSVLVLLFAFLAKPNIFVRIISVIGLIMVGLAASGGILYVMSNTQDRWNLGQMMDASAGVLIIYLVQIIFMFFIPWLMRNNISKQI